ncbi:MAG: putative spermidine/putrescine transport system ATP-binding protein [Acidobacteriota bacterium]|nr:putative spermidine/putrescine transport system ATP-binding protein [Acidobacteriota bacterium]
MKVHVEDVSFAYGREPVVSGVSLDLPEGGITVVIGPSGSGKSTLLQLLCGLLHPAQGKILFDDEDVTGVPTERRDVGVVFQSYALFPHLSVRENIAFGLKTGRRRFSMRSSRRRPSRRHLEERVWDAAALLSLERLLDRRPAQLSGGEQQRVALARAVAPRPSLLLLDEPLSALDARLRRAVRTELAALLAKLGTTTFYVTHDQEEAMLLADHLVVLDHGRVVQAGPPLDLYRRPATPFVASFLGEANLVEIEARPAIATPGRVETPFGSLSLPEAKSRGWLLVRPEDFTDDPCGAMATVLDARGMGPHDRVVLQLEGGTELLAHFPPETAPEPGSKVRVGVRQRRPHFLNGGE